MPVVNELENLLNQKITLYSLDEFEALDQSPDLSVIENTRFCVGEKTNDVNLSKRMAKLADIFVMDAFATSKFLGKGKPWLISVLSNATTGLFSFIDSLISSVISKSKFSILFNYFKS